MNASVPNLVPSSDAPHAAFTVRPLGADEFNRWDTALAASPQASVFLSTRFLRPLAEHLPEWQIVLLGCFERDQFVGGCVGREIPGERPTLDRLRITPWNGFWIAPAGAKLATRVLRREHAIMSALATAIEDRYDRAVIDCHTVNSDVRPLTWRGWQTGVRYTLTTNLRPLDETAFDPDVRRRFGLAQRAGVKFDDAVPVAEFEPLWRGTLARQKVTHEIPPDASAALLGALVDSGLLAINGARLADGRLVAAIAVLFSGDTASDWLSAYDADDPHRGASNQLCLVETLRAAARRARVFDWVGANTPEIAAYKQSFGAQLTPYYRATWRCAITGDAPRGLRGLLGRLNPRGGR